MCIRDGVDIGGARWVVVLCDFYLIADFDINALTVNGLEEGRKQRVCLEQLVIV